MNEVIKLLEKGDWRAAHEIVQQDEDSADACWAHAIVHLMEGDKANARYWFERAKRPYSEDIAAEIAALSERAVKRA
jgi:hypothetical protein